MILPYRNNTSPSSAVLNSTTSLYLDFLRLFAALLVFFYHASAVRLNGQWLSGIGNFGHDAVIVFFVLSGFVIAYSSERKSSDISDFLERRLARLYSVALPALFFTVIADSVGQHFKPEIYLAPYFEDSYPFVRFIHNLFFINELWFTSWRAFSNGPFWSLSYEFVYYVLFAQIFYLTGIKRALYASVTAILAGPKILLLLPTWLLGVLLFHLCKNSKLSLSIGVILILSSVCLYTLYRLSGLPDYLYAVTKDILGANFVRNSLEFSRWFLNDYIVAILVAFNILGVAVCSAYINLPQKLSCIIRYLAGITFTLYLFHYPLLQLFGSIFSSNAAVVILTILCVVLIAPQTEGRKSYWLKLVKQIHVRMRKPLHSGY